MKTIIFLVMFLVYLAMLAIVSSLLDRTIKISSRKTIPLSKLFVPSTLVIFTWVGFAGLYYMTLTKLGIDLPTYLINKFLNLPAPLTNMTLIVGVLGLYILAAIILQSLYVYLINFNLSKPFVIAKDYIVKMLCKNEKIKKVIESISKNDEEEKEDYKVDILTCFFSSILTFIMIFAFVFVLVFIANTLTEKILGILIK